MKYYNRTNPELSIDAPNRSLDNVKQEMKDICEALSIEFNEEDFIEEYSFMEVEKICKEELTDSDWRVSRAAERGEPLAHSWKEYREALRALINDEASGKITWPTKPENN